MARALMILGTASHVERTLTEMPLLARLPEWPRLRAVANDCVTVVDGNQYFNRPGPRLAESLEILAEILHPEIRPRRYDGNAWRHVGRI